VPWFDLPEDELRTYRCTTPEPDGLDEWWARRLAEARAVAEPAVLRRHQPATYGPLPVWDVEFSGAGGDRIRGWYLRPPGSAEDEPLPAVVCYVGYGGGRGLPVEHTLLPSAGFAVLVMDVRGQGGGWSVGATGDPGRGVGGPEHPGVLTRGIEDPANYYYTRLFVDAVRAVDCVAGLAGVDATRIAVSGASQGGGQALAAAALAGDLVRVCHADVPFLCDIQRAVTLANTRPYTEVADFLAQHIELVSTALNTLRYVDCALLARRITADCLLSVALMDEICPPSTVFAAYNEINAAKDIAVFPFSGHVVPKAHVERQLDHLRARLT
jgi:cephalosporin-C deacetylase